MRIDDRIAALRDDRVSQRLVHKRLDQGKADWLGQPMVRALIDEMEGYAGGSALSQLHLLSEVMTSHNSADQLVRDWQSHFAQIIAEEPLGHVPFKHNYSPGFATMRLIETGRVTLSLLAYEEVAQAANADAAAFSDREQHEIVIAGRAEGIIYTLPDGGAELQPVEARAEKLRAGSTITLDGARASRHIRNVRGRLLMLQLSRAAENPKPIREIRVRDGAMIHQSSGQKRESQTSMAMAVLTEMGRVDAAPCCAELAQDGPAYLRWDALRHTLALDPVRGFVSLGEIANNSADELAAPARSLREQLAEAHPQLLQLEAEQCLA